MAQSRPRSPIPLIGGTAKGSSYTASTQETVNWTLTPRTPGGKAPLILDTTPGNVHLYSVGSGPLRSPRMARSNVRASGFDLYGVYGRDLVCQTEAAGTFSVGTLDSTSGVVEMAVGRNYVALVDGEDLYTWDGETFAKASDEDLPAKPTHIVYQDGFFSVNDSESDNWHISALEDPTDWNALDFEAAAVKPDRALALASTASLLWVLGEWTAQPYFNSGNPDFPYNLSLTGVQPVGVLAPHSVAPSADGIFFLATSPEGGRFVFVLRGQSGQVVSGPEQDEVLANVREPSLAYGFCYKQAGQSYYVLQVGAVGGERPKESATLVYNVQAQAWETREMQDGSAWRVAGHGVLGGRNIAGSRLQGQQLELRRDRYEDIGQEIIRRRTTQVFHQAGHLLEWLEIVLDVQAGVGRWNERDPIIRLRYSDDGGRTWSAFITGEMGKLGEFDRRIIFRRLGQSRARVFEIVCSEPVPCPIIGAYAVVQPLRD